LTEFLPAQPWDCRLETWARGVRSKVTSGVLISKSSIALNINRTNKSFKTPVDEIMGSAVTLEGLKYCNNRHPKPTGLTSNIKLSKVRHQLEVLCYYFPPS
jgi:hypothetical protein